MYLKDFTLQKQCVPFCHYTGETGRYSQARKWGCTVLVVQKNAEFLLCILKNAESNEELKTLDVNSLVIGPGEQGPQHVA